jgi:hypothetical protein
VADEGDARHQPAARPERYFRTDGAEGTDFNIGRKLRQGVYNGMGRNLGHVWAAESFL